MNPLLTTNKMPSEQAITALINKASQTLQPFQPKKWACDVFLQLCQKNGENTLTKVRNHPQLKETLYFSTLEEAKKIAARKTQKFKTCNHEGSVRPSDNKDFAQQRLEDIQNALLEFLEKTLKSEENILIYDTFLFGKPNTTGLTEPLQKRLESCYD